MSKPNGKESKTLRIVMPQWQGGSNSNYSLGAELLAWLFPENEHPIVWVPISQISPVTEMKGSVLGSQLLEQLEAANHIIQPPLDYIFAYKTPTYHAIVSVRAGGEMQSAFPSHMAPSMTSKYNNSFLTKRHAQIYGRKWEELQEVLF
ncbi:arginase family protein [Halobacillus amylolyticus]|uniref:Uncharacterized protein n=1 Tax=Halobacillus amylolyticus TaxID=2932259 RepID=A0ABY4H5Y0_9BACI|nr:hypothetical protein [Halobacillus amylolyticus]UOR10255.1 hypothetical protein MUO15_11045 [Halobacillus amylolyticus]